MPTATMQLLLTGLIDYAGLFPPAEQSMADAVATYAAERSGEYAWMLGRFIVPLARLDELAAIDAAGDVETPWQLSVLVGGGTDDARATIEQFGADHGHRFVIDAVEAKTADPTALVAMAKAFEGLECFVEIPHDEDPGALMAALAENGLKAKIRTGGVIEAAFPTADEVARFVLTAVRSGVAFKATAGLHHPLRGRYRLTYAADSPSGTMFGFLNVFLAAALAQSDSIDHATLVSLLEEQDPKTLAVDDEHIAWRGHRVALDDLAETRGAWALSYGSCSFAEPVDDLRVLGLL